MSPRRAGPGPSRGTATAHFVLAFGALLVVAPVLWVIAAGFRTQISLLMGEVLFTPSLASFREVLFSKTSDFLLNYRNSILVGLASTAISLTAGTMAAWSLYRMRWPRCVIHGFPGWARLPDAPAGRAAPGAWYRMARSVGLRTRCSASCSPMRRSTCRWRYG